MHPESSPVTAAQAPPSELDLTSARLLLGTGAAVSVASALVYARWPAHLPDDTRLLLVASSAILSAIFAIVGWRARTLSRRRTGLAAGWVSAAGIALISVALGEGVHAAALGLLGLVVCMATVLAGARAGLALTGGCVLALLGLAGAELAGWLQGTPQRPFGLPLATHLMTLLTGLAVGAIIGRLAGRSLSALAEGEHRFAGLQRLAVDWYWEVDAQFRYTHVSENPGAGSGIAPDDRLGHTPWEIPGFGLDEAELDAHRADLESHRAFHGLLARRRAPGGHLRFVSISGEPKFDARGVFRGYWGVGRDVTHEVQAQLHIAASETRYRELFARSPSGLVLHHAGIVVDANHAAARLFGYSESQAMLGVDLIELHVPGPSRELARERMHTLAQMPIGEGLPVGDFQMRSRDGRRLSVQATGVQVEMLDGAPATLSLYFDITARLAAESALRRSEAMLSHLFATSPDCITVSELASGRYAMVNASFSRLTGYEAHEVIGRSEADVGTWLSAPDREHLIEVVAQQGKVDNLSTTFVARSGALLAMLVSAARFDMDGKVYVVMNARDMTASAQTRLRHQAILQHASIGIAFTRDGVFLEANRHCERMFGWPEGGLIGQPDAVVWPSAQDHAEIARLAAPLLAEGKALAVERLMRRRDSTLFWCRLQAQAVDPSHPSHGGTIWIAEDVTAQREADQALAAAHEAAQAGIRAKSAFLANTSHEIRTPLNGLLGLVRLARQADQAALREQYLTQIQDSAENLAEIISDILDLSKIEAGKITLEAVPFDLHDLLDKVYRGYASLADAKGLALTLDIDPALHAAVIGDPLRTRQILGNFVTNALKFTEHGHIAITAAAGPAGQVRLTVTDTGCGIDAATQARLFMPFSQADDSTTRRFGGTGLGLSICRQLAELMGGTVGVQSHVGQGSSFWAELPLPPAGAAAGQMGGAAADEQALRGARVLLVEDNPVNMMIAAAMLERWGIEVAQAGDGEHAIRLVDEAAARGQPFHAVLMDLQMPEISGHETARRLRQRHDMHRLPIIALTAAALATERQQALAAGMNDFLTKPIDEARLRATLARFVRDVAAPP